MGNLESANRRRWTVAGAVLGLFVGGAVVGTMGAAADDGLPPRSAEQLLVDLQQPDATALSGTVVTHADLGLPALPFEATGASGLQALASGSQTLRVWYDGPERARVALLGQAAETDVIRNGRALWTWSSADAEAVRYELPEADGDTQSHVPDATDLPKTPEEAARLALAALDGTTEVTTSGVAEVAGRDAYELILTPEQADTLVSRVAIAIDAETRIPLRVRVESTKTAEPAFEAAFTSIDYSKPDAANFEFTPPPGATVTERTVRQVPAAGAGDGEGTGEPSDEPAVVGTGWSRVVVGPVAMDQVAARLGEQGGTPGRDVDVMALLSAVPRVSGDWGSGWLVSGNLFSALVTDDGVMAAGAVAPEALYAALAKR
ncbi:MAG: hypothetical protein WCF04_13550 [Candidatus Nanopelagicales bacterium]